MDKEQYIIAFRAGSSGRFIANLVWGLITDVYFESPLTEYNSTHNFSLFAESFSMLKVPNVYRPYSFPDVYKYVELDDTCVFPIHAYPDFETISARFPSAKIIIISFDETMVDEISNNCLLKNGFERYQSTGISNNDTYFINQYYQSIFNEPFTNQPLTIDQQKEMFVQYLATLKDEIYAKYLSGIITVPDEFSDKTLVLNYSDIVNDKDRTINKLCEFTGKTIKPFLEDMYTEYLRGRKKLIETHTPWLLP